MLGRQIVTAPDGVQWRVGRRWLSHRVPHLWRRPWKRRKGNGDEGGWLDPTVAFEAADPSAGGIGLAVGLFLVLAVAVFVLLPLLGLALELVVAIALTGLPTALPEAEPVVALPPG